MHQLGGLDVYFTEQSVGELLTTMRNFGAWRSGTSNPFCIVFPAFLVFHCLRSRQRLIYDCMHRGVDIATLCIEDKGIVMVKAPWNYSFSDQRLALNGRLKV